MRLNEARMQHSATSLCRGLTLFELLMTLAIIGLLTAIALPSMSALQGGEVQETRHRRNAQEIASVFATAQAAGLNFATTGSLEQTVRNIIVGGSPPDGPFQNKIYAVKGLQEDDIAGVQNYLTLTGDVLSYHSHGVN